MQCDAGSCPGLVDMRPIGGGLRVRAMQPDMAPADRLQDSVLAQGEPAPGLAVMSALSLHPLWSCAGDPRPGRWPGCEG